MCAPDQGKNPQIDYLSLYPPKYRDLVKKSWDKEQELREKWEKAGFKTPHTFPAFFFLDPDADWPDFVNYYEKVVKSGKDWLDMTIAIDEYTPPHGWNPDHPIPCCV